MQTFKVFFLMAKAAIAFSFHYLDYDKEKNVWF